MAVKEQKADPEARTVCGLIMPISATANHSEKHWADVQELLHRAIRNAGMEPSNVWAGDLTDRISERIVGNIFSHDVIVADISDLNPNVMLELGLRLASKKPTIVVANSNGSIPFDIRDFEVISYPSDLNIIQMEAFFEKFSKIIKAKFAAFNSNKYQPFLGSVVVEVIEPKTKGVSVDSAVLDRLDDISRRISGLEKRQIISGIGPKPTQSIPSKMDRPIRQVYVWVPAESRENFLTSIASFPYPYNTVTIDGRSYFRMDVEASDTLGTAVKDSFERMAIRLGGGSEIDPSVLFALPF